RFVGIQVGQLEAEDVATPPLDLIDRDDLLVLAPQLAEDFLGQVDGHLAAGEGAKGDHPRERAFELADVRLDPARDEIRDVVAEADALERGLFLEDGHARLEVRRLDVGDQSPLESRAQTLLDLGNVLRRRVARDDDLLARLVQVVERVEEFFLSPLLARDELDVVDQEQIDRAIARPELRGPIVADRVDELVGEALGREIRHRHAGDDLIHGQRDTGMSANHLAGRLVERLEIVLGQPVARELVRCADSEVIPFDRDEPTRANPVVENWRGERPREGVDESRPEVFFQHGVALTCTQSYPQLWIARGIVYSRSIAPPGAHIRTKLLAPIRRTMDGGL